MNPYDTLQSVEITSAVNPRIKDLVRLRDGSHRRRMGLILIEGYRELSRALNAGIRPDAVYFCPEFFLGENEPGLLLQAQRSGAALFRVSETPFRKISYRDRPDGLIATAPGLKRGLSDLSPGESPFLVVAERIEKPGNLGTILRSADAVGVDGVIVCDPTTDINNPNVVRASTGTLFTVPLAEAATQETFAWLAEHGIALVAATPHAGLSYTEADFRGPLALAVGSEQYGLSESWLERADIRVRIPMKGVADSLNVATATTVLLFEVARQRQPR